MDQRLAIVAGLVAAENRRWERSDIAGFYPIDPHLLARVVPHVLRSMRPGDRSLDMGAGTGAWWLLMAAAGVPSYAIEIHPELAAACERLRATCVARGLIDRDVPCVVTCGDMIPIAWHERYVTFRAAHGEVEKSMPGAGDGDAYADLGIALDEFGIIYCWAWPTQSRFLYNLLADNASNDALLVLPSYVRYTTGEHMNASMKEPNRLFLDVLATESETVVGHKRNTLQTRSRTTTTSSTSSWRRAHWTKASRSKEKGHISNSSIT